MNVLRVLNKCSDQFGRIGDRLIAGASVRAKDSLEVFDARTKIAEAWKAEGPTRIDPSKEWEGYVQPLKCLGDDVDALVAVLERHIDGKATANEAATALARYLGISIDIASVPLDYPIGAPTYKSDQGFEASVKILQAEIVRWDDTPAEQITGSALAVTGRALSEHILRAKQLGLLVPVDEEPLSPQRCASLRAIHFLRIIYVDDIDNSNGDWPEDHEEREAARRAHTARYFLSDCLKGLLGQPMLDPTPGASPKP